MGEPDEDMTRFLFVTRETLFLNPEICSVSETDDCLSSLTYRIGALVAVAKFTRGHFESKWTRTCFIPFPFTY